ncbi:hypothetical protein CTI12_AA225810 [Artemisia annua]|uniref:Helitron helicase-like domain-containing protein n=1 Tax=Artemisia annua TaxID=35608 RepID=A0A2U1NUA8_ARTAN|nr:hypothetical protein CTI12_AA225810 [Artemisia annua]
MDKNKQPFIRKRKEPQFSGQNHQPSRTPSVPLTQIPTPQVLNRRVPLSDLLTPPSSNRVSLTELLTYDPLKENLPPFSLSNTSSTQPSKHSASSTTHQQPRASNRLPLGNVTNRLNPIPNQTAHQGPNVLTSPISQDSIVGNANLRGVSSISLPRSDHQPSIVAATRPFALMDSQPTVTTSPSSNALIRTPSNANSFESPTRVALNTSDTVRLSRTTSNGLAASFDPATPVNDTRTQQFPVSDVSNVSLHTPLTSVGCVNRCNNIRSTDGFTTSIPAIVTQTSNFEVGESSRRTKRSKRPSLQSRTPVRSNLNVEDGDVRKEYDKYIGVSEEYFDHGDPTFECTECHALVWEAEARKGNANPTNKSYSICCGKGKVGSSSSSGQSTSDDRIDRNIIGVVRDVLDSSSDLVQTFRRARDRYNEDSEQNIKIRLIAKRGKDGRNYNLPTSNEVAGLIVGDFDTCIEDRDIVIEKYREGIPHRRKAIGRPGRLPNSVPLKEKSDNTVTMREWFAFQIMDRPNQENLFTRGGRLFQQFLVDGYTMVETERLFFHRSKQTKLRCDTYSNIRQSVASVSAQLYKPGTTSNGEQVDQAVDEIQAFLDCRFDT